jgi:hypothetical protein
MSAEAGVSSLVLFKFGAGKRKKKEFSQLMSDHNFLCLPCESILPNDKFRILEILIANKIREGTKGRGVNFLGKKLI